MSLDDIQSMREALAWARKELDLILAIDRVRDRAAEPSQMLAEIADLLLAALPALVCQIWLADRASGALSLAVARAAGGALAPQLCREAEVLAQAAARSDSMRSWDADQLPACLRRLDAGRLAQAAGVPIDLEGERLGVILLIWSGRALAAPQLHLLEVVETQVDSAVLQIHTLLDYRQRQRELETIYRLDRIRDQELGFDDMLAAMLGELRGTLRAQVAFLIMHDPEGQQSEVRTSAEAALLDSLPALDTIKARAREAIESRQMVCCADAGADGRCRAICLPLFRGERPLAALGVADCRAGPPFSPSDQRLLRAVAGQIDTTLFEGIERRRLRQLLGRSVDPRVMEQMLAGPLANVLAGKRLELSVLYADLRGSTALAERMAPEQFVAFMNDALRRMTEVILAHEGTLDKFLGDGAMALFGAPLPQADHALRAVRAALEMQRAHQALIAECRARRAEAAPIGIGIASGALIAGEIGSPRRADYTVIGRPAMLGARICAMAGPDEVLVSAETFAQVADLVEARPIPDVELKGISGTVRLFAIQGLKPENR